MTEQELREYAAEVAGRVTKPADEFVVYHKKEKTIAYDEAHETKSGLFKKKVTVEYEKKTKRIIEYEKSSESHGGWVLDSFFQEHVTGTGFEFKELITERIDYYYLLETDGTLSYRRVTTMFVDHDYSEMPAGAARDSAIRTDSEDLGFVPIGKDVYRATETRQDTKASMRFSEPSSKYSDGLANVSTLLLDRSAYMLDIEKLGVWRQDFAGKDPRFKTNYIDMDYAHYYKDEAADKPGASPRVYEQGGGLKAKLGTLV
ncbi:MAG: hypothetical protein LBS90_01455 [Oscillospiraceae bacterium]|jgi:hypothetical protein|nr:hypothetical protein [Oscillospiraceae bacterium]